MNEILKAPSRGNALLVPALIASLLANLAMGAVLGRRPKAAARAAAVPVLTAHATSPFWRAPRPPSQVRADLSRFAGVWARLEARDYSALVQNLRAVGCPEAAVRNIVIPRIDADFEKRKELELPKPEYWRTASQFAALKRRIMPRWAALETAKHQRIRSFWPGQGCGRGESLWLVLQLSGLSPDMDWNHARAFAAAYEELAEEAGALQEADSDFILVEDVDRVRRSLDRFQQSVPAGFLEELAVRAQQPSLAGVELTEQELREVCRLRSLQPGREQGLFDLFPILKMAAQKEEEKSPDLPEDLIRALLGPDRYAAYQRDQDGDFQRMWALAQSANLPLVAAAQTFEEVNTTRQALDALSSDPALAPGQKEAAMTQLTEATTEKLKSLLGENAYQTFSANGLLNFARQTHGSAQK